MTRTGKYRIILDDDSVKPVHYWTYDKTWSPEPERAKIYNWEEKWAVKGNVPRNGIWEEIKT